MELQLLEVPTVDKSGSASSKCRSAHPSIVPSSTNVWHVPVKSSLYAALQFASVKILRPPRSVSSERSTGGAESKSEYELGEEEIKRNCGMYVHVWS